MATLSNYTICKKSILSSVAEEVWRSSLKLSRGRFVANTGSPDTTDNVRAETHDKEGMPLR